MQKRTVVIWNHNLHLIGFHLWHLNDQRLSDISHKSPSVSNWLMKRISNLLFAMKAMKTTLLLNLIRYRFIVLFWRLRKPSLVLNIGIHHFIWFYPRSTGKNCGECSTNHITIILEVTKWTRQMPWPAPANANIDLIILEDGSGCETETTWNNHVTHQSLSLELWIASQSFSFSGCDVKYAQALSSCILHTYFAMQQ